MCREEVATVCREEVETVICEKVATVGSWGSSYSVSLMK